MQNPRVEIRFIVKPGLVREQLIRNWLEPSITAFINDRVEFEDGVTTEPVKVFTLLLTKREYKPSS